LNASIIETVSATLENGEVKTAKIGGEIALAYNKVEADDSSSKYYVEFTAALTDLK
jgi:hypothetical protein